MTDETRERDDEDGHPGEEHPLESPEALRQPREEEEDQASDTGATPDLDDR